MKAVFLERDGTIGGDGGGVHPFEFTLYDFSAEAIKILNNLGIKVFIFTNQSWIGFGKFTEETFLNGYRLMEDILKTKNAFLDGVYYCPHSPDGNCECRKPQTQLLEKASKEYDLDLKKSYVIGDRLSDLLAAEKVGAKKILVKTGRGEKTLMDIQGKFTGVLEIDFIAEDVLEAAYWIEEKLKKS